MPFPEIVAEWLRICSPAGAHAGMAMNQRGRAEIDRSVRGLSDAADPEPKKIWLTQFAGELVMRLRPSTPLKAARAIASRQWSEMRHLPPREAALVWHGTNPQ